MDRGWYLRLALMLGVTILGALALWPSLEQWIPCPDIIKTTFTQRLSPGLDIRGGLRLVYEVDVEEAISDRTSRTSEHVHEQIGRDLGVITDDGVPNRETLAKVNKRVRVRANPDTRRITMEFARASEAARVDRRFLERFDIVREIQRDEAAGRVVLELREDRLKDLRDTAVAQAVQVVSNRIDELQIRETSVDARDENIVIEIPGADESVFSRTRDLVSRTARLEFKITDDESDFIQRVAQDLPEGLTRETETGSAGASRPSVTSYYVKATGPRARQNLRRWIDSVRDQVPEDHQLAMGEMDEEDTEGETNRVSRRPRAWRTWYLFARSEVGGDFIQDAGVAFDPRDNSPYVSLNFNAAGADIFETLTGNNVKRRMAIVLDDIVKSAPVIQTRIPGGRCQITLGGMRDFQQIQREAQDLVVVLRAGALPAPIRPSNEQMIGPSIGADAIEQGIEAAVVGTALALLFMAIYYALGGLVADLMVLLNCFLVLAAMAALGATISLPGLAGLALTVGMSLDSNVLINERIREEQRAGKSPRAAIEAGYERAFWSVMDAQITTLIAGIVLFQYGSGPIKGFATTLMIGIVASLFTGVFCSRVVFDYLVKGLKLSRINVG
ncbi:MAG: protein translocase subunit SecD [Deltaproteobacteria bacterium]|nr:protein translocase subunit SecD [Deltaproteobacteria bacterium]